jgi:hypothetical protein
LKLAMTDSFQIISSFQWNGRRGEGDKNENMQEKAYKYRAKNKNTSTLYGNEKRNKMYFVPDFSILKMLSELFNQ